jgi:hypothetical protein
MSTQIILLLVGFTFISSLELYIRIFNPSDLLSGFYLQAWTSDTMMQTLPIQQLHDAPLENLFYLHIQPPMLDTIRAFLAALSPKDGGVALEHFVDGSLYVVWGVLYAILAVLVFVWIRAATGSVKIAGVAYASWLLYPGGLAMATLLEGTMLSAVLTTWMLYELWRFSEKRGSELRIAAAGILLFLTRTVFQWYFILVLVMALWIAGASRKSIFRIVTPILLIVAVFLLKQSLLFGTISTTTFAGEHKLGLIQYHPTVHDIKKYTTNFDYKYPEGARRYMAKYNSEKQVIKNIIFERIASERLNCCFMESMKEVVRSMYLNIVKIGDPTSVWGGPFLNRLFWRGPYDFIFSRPFIVPLMLAIVFWICRNRLRLRATRTSLAPAIFAAYVLMILLISNRYQWTEVNRLKFFLQPTAYVFVVTQFVFALRWVRGWLVTSKQDAERIA